MVLERDFQKTVIDELEQMLPGCIVMKNDPNYLQGIPDLTIVYGSRWFTLEVKKSARETHQPNQDWYVDTMDRMSFSRFIFPENKEEVLDEIQRSFGDSRRPRVSKRK